MLALGLFQLGFAFHQSDHNATDLLDSCSICTHYDQFDDAPLTATAVAATQPVARESRVSLVTDRESALFRPYHSRAPPTI